MKRFPRLPGMKDAVIFRQHVPECTQPQTGEMFQDWNSFGTSFRMYLRNPVEALRLGHHRTCLGTRENSTTALQPEMFYEE